MTTVSTVTVITSGTRPHLWATIYHPRPVGRIEYAAPDGMTDEQIAALLAPVFALLTPVADQASRERPL